MLVRHPALRASRATIGAVLSAALIIGAGAACSDDTTAPRGTVNVSEIQLQQGTETGLLAVATFHAPDADSARAWYTMAGGSPRDTPFAPVSSGVTKLVVTGLAPSTPYQIYIEARAGSDSGFSETKSFTTEELPDVLRNISIAMTTGSYQSGYILTALVGSDSTLYAVAFDSAGTLAWYRHFAGYNQIGDLQQQPNGNFTIYLGGSTGWQPVPGEFDELTAAGDITHKWVLPAPYYTDGHEIRLTVQDTTVVAAYLFGYDQRPMDMTGHGGGANDLVSVHQIFRLSPGGNASQLFNAMDRWTLSDWISPPLTDAGDMDHPNSLDFDSDGNLLVSWRNLGAITKHDVTTGAVIWQLGGTQADLSLEGDPLDGIGGQHFARALPGGHILLYDNGTNHTPGESRPVEYAIDAANKRATFVWDYRRPSPIFTTFMGSAQRLPNGNTLVGYSTSAVLTEVDPLGTVVAEGQIMDGGTPVQFYRALWVARLGK